MITTNLLTGSNRKRYSVDGALVSKARDSLEAVIPPIANVIGVVSTSDAFVYVDSTALFLDTDGLLAGSFSLAYIAEVGFGTTAVYGINYENMTGIEPLVANVQGYIGVVTGISTVAGIGTDLALQIQFDVQDYVNNGNDPTGLQTGQPFKLYGTGINTAGVAVTSIDTHDTDVVQSAPITEITFTMFMVSLLSLEREVVLASLLQILHLTQM